MKVAGWNAHRYKHHEVVLRVRELEWRPLLWFHPLHVISAAPPADDDDPLQSSPPDSLTRPSPFALFCFACRVLWRVVRPSRTRGIGRKPPQPADRTVHHRDNTTGVNNKKRRTTRSRRSEGPEGRTPRRRPAPLSLSGGPIAAKVEGPAEDGGLDPSIP